MTLAVLSRGGGVGSESMRRGDRARTYILRAWLMCAGVCSCMSRDIFCKLKRGEKSIQRVRLTLTHRRRTSRTQPSTFYENFNRKRLAQSYGSRTPKHRLTLAARRPLPEARRLDSTVHQAGRATPVAHRMRTDRTRTGVAWLPPTCCVPFHTCHACTHGSCSSLRLIVLQNADLITNGACASRRCSVVYVPCKAHEEHTVNIIVHTVRGRLSAVLAVFD